MREVRHEKLSNLSVRDRLERRLSDCRAFGPTHYPSTSSSLPKEALIPGHCCRERRGRTLSSGPLFPRNSLRPTLSLAFTEHFYLPGMSLSEYFHSPNIPFELGCHIVLHVQDKETEVWCAAFPLSSLPDPFFTRLCCDLSPGRLTPAELTHFPTGLSQWVGPIGDWRGGERLGYFFPLLLALMLPLGSSCIPPGPPSYGWSLNP